MRKQVIYRNFRIVEISPESGMWLLKLEKKYFTKDCLLFHELFFHYYKCGDIISKWLNL